MTQLVYVFDLDDTLISEREYACSGFRAVGNFVQQECDVIGFEELAVSCFNQGLRGHIFNEVLNNLGLKITEDFVAKLVDVYRNHLPDIGLLVDARKCLDLLKAKKIPMALITDGYAVSQRKKIASINLSKWIDLIIVTDELGSTSWKPSPDAYLKVMQCFQGVAERFIYVGDNPLKDFVTPKKMGWQTARVLRTKSEHANTVPPTPDHAPGIEVRSLTELIQSVQ